MQGPGNLLRHYTIQAEIGLMLFGIVVLGVVRALCAACVDDWKARVVYLRGLLRSEA